MTDICQKKCSAISCLLWHRDRYYSFFIPDNWYPLRWSDDRRGTIYAPDPTEPQTAFAVAVTRLDTQVTAADLDILAEGLFEGIGQLPDLRLEARYQEVVGDLLELEAKYTFRDQGELRKCWARVFYFAKHQIVVTAQGATPEKYDYWLPWFFEAMTTMRIHTAKPTFLAWAKNW